MYRHIDQHVEALIHILRRERHVEEYDELVRRFRQPTAAQDPEFQRQYAHFWGFHQALDPTWRENYFKWLQKIASQRDREPRHLLECTLHEIGRNLASGQSVEFSFAAKLVHTLAPESPIYDAKIRDFYLLPETMRGRNFEERIGYGLRIYDALVEEYNRVLQGHLLDKSIALFRRKLHPHAFTPIKIIDSLIWVFVKWAKKDPPRFGAGELRYK